MFSLWQREEIRMKYNSGLARRPAIFVSSTCYDLKQIRQNMRDFIEEDLGYEAILSEYDSFPIDPDKDTVDNCLRVVEERADILVLIVGGRYGYITNHGDKSITNLEYLRARTKGIPIFVFIDQSIINILPIWKKNSTADFSDIVDSPKIFDFVDILRNKDSNWVYEFNNGKDIVKCLKKQLAYLVNDCFCLRRHFQKEGVSSKILEYSGRVFELAVEKPDFWEYLLFAAALKDNLDRLENLRYDMKYGITFKRAVLYDEPQEIINFVQTKCNELINRVDVLNIILNNAFQEAVGEPGMPGNAEYIIYVAEKLIEVYKSIHEWSLEFKSIIVPDEFKNLMLYASQLSISVIEDIENFISEYDKKINEVVLGIDKESEKQTLSFVLSLRSPDMAKINSEISNIAGLLL